MATKKRSSRRVVDDEVEDNVANMEVLEENETVDNRTGEILDREGEVTGFTGETVIDRSDVGKLVNKEGAVVGEFVDKAEVLAHEKAKTFKKEKPLIACIVCKDTGSIPQDIVNGVVTKYKDCTNCAKCPDCVNGIKKDGTLCVERVLVSEIEERERVRLEEEVEEEVKEEEEVLVDDESVNE